MIDTVLLEIYLQNLFIHITFLTIKIQIVQAEDINFSPRNHMYNAKRHIISEIILVVMELEEVLRPWAVG
jgi:hypothetical protein